LRWKVAMIEVLENRYYFRFRNSNNFSSGKQIIQVPVSLLHRHSKSGSH
jgi:hypothetical protein